MSFRPNLRRVFATWTRAALLARGWGYQTGRKHRIRRCRGGYRVERTTKPVDYGPPFAKNIGEVRVTIVIDQGE